MDMTCRCSLGYTCVACRVKRGDYKDWMDVKCSVPGCGDKIRAMGMCMSHYDKARWRVTA